MTNTSLQKPGLQKYAFSPTLVFTVSKKSNFLSTNITIVKLLTIVFFVVAFSLLLYLLIKF